MSTIVGITPRVQELGRIRFGDKNADGWPVSLSTFRLTSADRRLLEVAASVYGGTVRPWEDAPDPGYHELITEASSLNIVVPRSLESVTQAWEMWKGGTCERRCNGIREEISDGPCICGDARGTGDDVCDVVTRLSVLLPDVPGLGVWRLDTGGYNAASTIPKTIEFLLALDQRSLVPAVLRLEQRSTNARRDDGKVEKHRFIVPVLDTLDHTVRSFIEAQVGPGDEAVAAIPDAVERPPRQSAEERVAARAAAIESGPEEPVRRGAGTPAGVEPSLGNGEAPPAVDPDAVCGVIPDPDNALNMKAPCSQRLAEHHPKLHKSSEGSWPR